MPATDTKFSLRSIAVAAFGPSLLFGLGEGAIFPVIALSAKGLGASVALSGLIVALFGIGTLINTIPAAMVTTRYGERRAMVGASIFSVFALILCLLAPHAWVLGLGVFMIGMANAVFMLARQTYLLEAVPISMRARAMSTLGGTMRIGLFIGPFAGAALMHFIDLPGAYLVAIAATVGAGILSYMLPDLEAPKSATQAKKPGPKISDLLHVHAKVYVTLGAACSLVSAIRACRQIVIPLWASHIGLDAATTAVVYGLMSSVDMLLFYPAGKVMDKYGRQWVAIPSMVLMAIALLCIPFTGVLTSFLIVSMVLGFGNGIGSGLIMTIGADASPPHGRTHFLGIWRFIADLGSAGGPLLLSGITAAVSLGAGIATIGVLGFMAAGIFARWLSLTEPQR